MKIVAGRSKKVLDAEVGPIHLNYSHFLHKKQQLLGLSIHVDTSWKEIGIDSVLELVLSFDEAQSLAKRILAALGERPQS